MPPKSGQRLSFTRLAILSLVGFAAVLWITLPRILHGDWNRTFAKLADDRSIIALVHGYTDNLADGWNVSLIWKKGDDRWHVYYLNHEAYFESYELRHRDRYIDVFCNGTLMGQLDTSTAEFFHARQNFLYKKPIGAIHSANMEDYEKWSYWP